MSMNWKLIDDVIVSNLQQLQKPNVLTVRPGYKMTAGKLSATPAIIATVAQKGTVAASDNIPTIIGAYPTDVRQATTLELLRQRDPQAFQAEQLRGRPEFRQPVHPYERDVISGIPINPPARLSNGAKKPLWPYQPPTDATLDPVTDTFDLILHVSPDAGWVELSRFLRATTQSLTVGMYDFTSAHILQDVITTLSNTQQLSMVLDHPAPNPSADQSDEQTEAILSAQLQHRLHFAWAAETCNPEVMAGYFPNAYHIKVAVRDSQAFWLSSGNWNNSNQPNIDPFTNPAAAAAIADHCDRDWHVIVTHPGLAKTLETYLLNDLAMAKKVQRSTQTTDQDQDQDQDQDHLCHPSPEQYTSGVLPTTYYHPKVLTRVQATIQPVLTPDSGVGNYVANFLQLINGAQVKLYLQTQYIHPPHDDSASGFWPLIQAVVAKMQSGLDVRVILSQYEATHSWLERLQDAGFNLHKVRIQNRVHNKGFVIDSKIVAIGSQNWSADGVLHNRDASLIIHNQEAAHYFEEVFLHDWNYMTQACAS